MMGQAWQNLLRKAMTQKRSVLPMMMMTTSMTVKILNAGNTSPSQWFKVSHIVDEHCQQSPSLKQ
jgi:hypothetical protein